MTVSTSPPPKRLPPLDRKSSGTVSGGAGAGSTASSSSSPPTRAKPLPPPKARAAVSGAPEKEAPVAPPKKDLSRVSKPQAIRASRSSGMYGPLGRSGLPLDIKDKPVALAVEDYDAENHREISFKKDEKIYVTFWSPHTSWWKGWIGGEAGYFPKENVKPLFDVDEANDSSKTKANTIRGGDNTQDKKRRQLISSIASTEELYVKDLQLIPDMIMRELQSVLSSSESNDIFRNIETICSETKSNLALFNRKAKTEEPVGDVFLRMAELFEVEVIPWAEAQPHIIAAMERLSFSNPEFAQCVESVQEKLGGVSIYEWFYKPVRRALEGVSIVKMLLVKTPQDNSDFADLSEAQETLGRVREFLKVPSEEIESLLKIVALQSAMQGQEPLVSGTRRFLREYSVQEVLRGGKKASDRKVVLLSDMMVVVKVKRTGYGQGSSYPLTRVQCNAVADATPTLKYCFELTVVVGTKKEKRRFSMVSASDRDSFLAAVTQAASSAGSGGAGGGGTSNSGGSGTGSLLRESSSTMVGAANSSENLPKKGIFQKLRSARSMSIGGDDQPPEIASDRARPPTVARQSSTANAASTISKSPRVVDKSPRVTRESSPRVSDSNPVAGGSEEARKSPRTWASASQPSSATSAQPTRESSAAETTTTLSRGSSVMCTACGEPVVGSALNSKGKFFHSQCYKCTECSKSLIGIPFAEKKGVPFCRDCALTLFSEPCAGCGKMITGQFLSAFGEKYHPACFVCAAGCGTNVSRGYAKVSRPNLFSSPLLLVLFFLFTNVHE